MAVIEDLIGVCLAGFLIVAALSLRSLGAPPTPGFARRSAQAGTVALRPDGNAGFIFDRGFLFRRRCWFAGTCCPPTRIPMSRYRQLSQVRLSRPAQIAQHGPRVWWWLEDDFYWAAGRYTARDVLAMVRDRQRRAAQRLDRAHLLLNVDEGRAARPRGRREAIPREMRRAFAVVIRPNPFS